MQNMYHRPIYVKEMEIMDSVTVTTKDNRDIELKRLKKREKHFRYEEIARAYMDYIERHPIGADKGKERGKHAVQ